jgi:hypothetical protein
MLQVGEWNGSISYPPVVLRRLPSKQPPHPHEVIVQLETGSGEVGHHGHAWWLDLDEGGELERKGMRWRV